MEGFRAAGSTYVSRIDDLEREVLVNLFEDVIALLSREDDPRHPGVVDPALMRVFPAASLEDPELEGEIRALTHAEVSAAKLYSLNLVTAAMRRRTPQIVVQPEAVADWLRALNDVRLVLSERLGISDDADAERFYQMALEATRSDVPADTCGDEQTLAMASLYAGLSWWQGSLLEALEPRAS
ncbi:MAG: DUF2017 domain-containing protein [Ruaniaceae bacterium]|nr:DUF2017 domain-containing protein [Ruaniaceae bacterium]